MKNCNCGKARIGVKQSMGSAIKITFTMVDVLRGKIRARNTEKKEKKKKKESRTPRVTLSYSAQYVTLYSTTLD